MTRRQTLPIDMADGRSSCVMQRRALPGDTPPTTAKGSLPPGHTARACPVCTARPARAPVVEIALIAGGVFTLGALAWLVS